MTDTARLHEIPGFLFHDEGEELLRLAAMVDVPGHVLEVGSFKGKSTAFLAQGCRNRGHGLVFAVDHFAGSAEHRNDGDIRQSGTTYGSFVRNLTSVGLLDVVVPLVGTSEVIAAGWRAPLRLLFIDGGHGHDDVSRDFAGFAPFVGVGGMVAFHDYTNTEHPHVKAFIDSVALHRVALIDSLVVFERRA